MPWGSRSGRTADAAQVPNTRRRRHVVQEAAEPYPCFREYSQTSVRAGSPAGLTDTFTVGPVAVQPSSSASRGRRVVVRRSPGR